MDLRHETIEEFLKICIAERRFPGAVYLVGERDRIIAMGALGYSVLEPIKIEMCERTIFDIASLTKPLCTALLAVILAGHRIFNLNDGIHKFLPRFKEGQKKRIKIIHLLAHMSGLPRWLPLYLHGDDLESRITYLSRIDLKFTPGEWVLYGCPAYIVAAEIIKRAAGERINKLFRDLVTTPLKLKETGFNPPTGKLRRIAASERGNQFEKRLASGMEKKEAARYAGWRKKVIWGESHDHSSFTLGGIAGNAGLFSTVEELFVLSKEFLGFGRGILDRSERNFFLKNLTEGLNEDRTPGWQMASSKESSAGPYLSDSSIGHTGFTGVSLWIDPDRKRTYILLTNRTHPVYREFNMNAIRRRFHRIAASL
ncbi:MAG: serine hydrolase domain-containing protein [Acidobacteriota bacterium]